MKVLIAEDNADGRKLLIKQLNAYGCEVTSAVDGAEALAEALAQPPDVIVSDILMPKMDGYQLCHEWKRIDKLKAIPFIFYTATYTKDEDKKFAMSMGISAFVVKPADPDILINIIRDTIEKAKSDSLVPHVNVPLEQTVFLTEYGKRVSAKLEDKVAQLEFETSQRKRSEEALKISEAQLKGAQALGRIGSREFDFETGETTWSEETYVLHERNPKLGPPSPEEEQQQYYSSEQAKVIRDYWAKAIDTGLTLSYDTEVILPSGKEAFYHVIMQTVKGYQGKAVKMSGTVQDITERKRSEEALQASYGMLRKTMDSVVRTIAATVEMRDPYTAGHQRRVALLARSIAREMGLPTEQVNEIYTAGTIHDIGKMQVPAEILSKPGKLSDIEFSLVKMHPKVGHDILKNVDFPYPLSRWVLEHHERLNGSGYPKGLTAENISLEAKILTVADVTEAMASHRPYRAALGMERALAEISKNRGILYDANAVDACLKVIREGGFKLAQ